jgi:hypothetical protein
MPKEREVPVSSRYARKTAGMVLASSGAPKICGLMYPRGGVE